MNRPNPNLVVILHYLSKTLWLVLAAIFGHIGYGLYAIGVSQTGTATAGFERFLNLKLTNAGPGLVVMVFALACALIGAVRSKVSFQADGGLEFRMEPHVLKIEPEVLRRLVDEETNEKPSSDAEAIVGFKVFSNLLRHLVEHQEYAFVVVDKEARIGLESCGWAAVPPEIRAATVTEGANLCASERTRPQGKSIGIWKATWRKIFVAEQRHHWCLVSLKTEDPAYQRAITSADTAPIETL